MAPVVMLGRSHVLVFLLPSPGPEDSTRGGAGGRPDVVVILLLLPEDFIREQGGVLVVMAGDPEAEVVCDRDCVAEIECKKSEFWLCWLALICEIWVVVVLGEVEVAVVPE